MPLSSDDYGWSRGGLLAPTVRPPKTARQQQHWLRILDATVDTAARGGYGEVRMRDIARRAKVSVATVYYHFPSKVHLLTTVLGHELNRFDEVLGECVKDLDDPFARLRVVTELLVEAMERSERVAEALTHAYATACVTPIDEGEQIRRQTVELLARHLDRDQHDIAEMLADIWTWEIISLVQGRTTFTDLRTRMTTAIALLDRNRRSHNRS